MAETCRTAAEKSTRTDAVHKETAGMTTPAEKETVSGRSKGPPAEDIRIHRGIRLLCHRRRKLPLRKNARENKLKSAVTKLVTALLQTGHENNAPQKFHNCGKGLYFIEFPIIVEVSAAGRSPENNLAGHWASLK